MERNRRKGRPPIPEEKKRRKISVTLPPELLARAEKSLTERDEASISELLEAALRQVLNEEEDDMAKEADYLVTS